METPTSSQDLGEVESFFFIAMGSPRHQLQAPILHQPSFPRPDSRIYPPLLGDIRFLINF